MSEISPRFLAKMLPQLSPGLVPTPRMDKPPSTTITTPAAKNPTDIMLGTTLGTMCVIRIERFFMPIDSATRTKSRPVHESAEDRASRPSTGIMTNVSDKMSTSTRGIPADGLNGSGLENTATITRTRTRVGIDRVTLKYIVTTESTQPRR